MAIGEIGGRADVAFVGQFPRHLPTSEPRDMLYGIAEEYERLAKLAETNRPQKK